MTRIATVDVERLTHTGEGVATLDEKTLLLTGALPGERVRAEIANAAKVLRGQVLEVSRPSSDRVEPPCAHARRCGGCDLMHASAALQRKARRAAVVEPLRSVFGDALPEPILHAPTPPLAYRSRARLVVQARAGATQIGFRRSRSHKLAAIDSCAVLRPELAAAIPRLEELVSGSEGSGDARLALGEERRLSVDLRWSGRLDEAVFARADAWVKDGFAAGVQLWEGEARTPASFGDPRACVTGVDGEPLWIPAGGFAQASDEGGRLLAERVGALASKRAGGLTIELFAGSGTLTIAACGAAERYVAVERDEAAVAMLRHNLALRGLTAKAIAADAETYGLRRPVATVILDPPRAGAPRACEAIAAARPRQVIYVSCNPATLARDVAGLAAYRVEDLEIVELFPQTSHVETIVRLVRS